MKRIVLFLVIIAMTGCRGPSVTHDPKIPDEVYDRLTVSARAAFQRGDIERADELYLQALNRARVMDRPSEIGASAYHLAICRIAAGEVASGIELLQKADNALKDFVDDRIPVLIASAEAYRMINNRSAATNYLDEALNMLGRRRARPLRVQIHTLQAMIAIEEGRVQDAERALARAGDNMESDMPLRMHARIAEIEGLLYMRGGDYLSAAAAFDREANLYRDAAIFKDMVRARTRSAQASSRAGEYMAAAENYFRAARSQFANGYTDAAQRLLEQAQVNLENVADNDQKAHLALRIKQLNVQINASP